MRKLLQSKAVVVSLLAIALLAWIGNSLRSPGRVASDRALNTRPDAENASVSERMESMPPTELAVTAALRQGLVPKNFPGARSNPFVYPDAPGATSPLPTNAGLPVRTPVLQAISIGPRGSLAVIDRTVVGPGEQVMGWRVDRIEADVVWVEGLAGRIALRLPRGAANTEGNAIPVTASQEPTIPFSLSLRSEAEVGEGWGEGLSSPRFIAPMRDRDSEIVPPQEPVDEVPEVGPFPLPPIPPLFE